MDTYGNLETAITGIKRAAWRQGKFPARHTVVAMIVEELGGRSAVEEALATLGDGCYLFTASGYPIGRGGLQQLLEDTSADAKAITDIAAVLLDNGGATLQIAKIQRIIYSLSEPRPDPIVIAIDGAAMSIHSTVPSAQEFVVIEYGDDADAIQIPHPDGETTMARVYDLGLSYIDPVIANFAADFLAGLYNTDAES